MNPEGIHPERIAKGRSFDFFDPSTSSVFLVRRFFARLHLPKYLPHNPEPNHRITRRQIKPAHQSANPFFRVRHPPHFQKAAGMQRVEQLQRNSLHFPRRSPRQFLRQSRSLTVANDFVQTHRDSLPQVHRNVFFARGDAHQPMAMAQILIRQPKLLRPKKQRHPARSNPPANQPSAVFQPPQRMVQLPMSHRRRSHHQSAVCHRFSHALVLFSFRKKRRSPHSRPRFAKRRFIRIHHTQVSKPKVAHRASSGPDVQRIAHRHQNDPHTLELRRRSQGCLF